jgi:hypothetical protein
LSNTFSLARSLNLYAAAVSQDLLVQAPCPLS